LATTGYQNIRNSLVRVFKNRPTWIKDPESDWLVCLSVHDSYFLRIQTYYKVELIRIFRNAGDNSYFKRVLNIYKNWLREENYYYKLLKVNPPTVNNSIHIRNIKRCKQCKKIFPLVNKNRLFCSPKCKSRYGKINYNQY